MPDKALVVGISKYLPPTQELTAPALEAAAWAALLPAFGIGDPTVRTDSDATLTEVHDRLLELFDGAQPGERRVFIYCGHGTVVPTANQMGDEALQLFHSGDTLADAEAATLTDTMLTAIVRKAKPSPDALITIVLDCCFSGGYDIKPPQNLLRSGDRVVAAGLTLFAPLLDVKDREHLVLVQRFGSLSNKRDEVAAVDPLVVAACERFTKAAELPTGIGDPPHLAFSGFAIPALEQNQALTHEELCEVVNKQVAAQRAVVLGNESRRSNPFFT